MSISEENSKCIKCHIEFSDDPIICHCCGSAFCDECIDYVCKYCSGCCLCEKGGKFIKYNDKRCKNCRRNRVKK